MKDMLKKTCFQPDYIYKVCTNFQDINFALLLYIFIFLWPLQFRSPDSLARSRALTAFPNLLISALLKYIDDLHDSAKIGGPELQLNLPFQSRLCLNRCLFSIATAISVLQRTWKKKQVVRFIRIGFNLVSYDIEHLDFDLFNLMHLFRLLKSPYSL